MPSNFKSPYASSFNTAIKRGTPCWTVIQNIAKRGSKNPNIVANSLFKAGLCFRQKFNGQWVYWACDGVKGNSTNSKVCQWNMWQCFVDWCICSGQCTPEQIQHNCGSQVEFMNWCRKFFAKQFNTNTVRTTGRKRVTRSKSRTSTGRSYKVSSHRKSTSRRYSRAV